MDVYKESDRFSLSKNLQSSYRQMEPFRKQSLPFFESGSQVLEMMSTPLC